MDRSRVRFNGEHLLEVTPDNLYTLTGKAKSDTRWPTSAGTR